MQFSFSYQKKKVIQALRYHFISRREIKIMMILVNVFAIASAVLFYSQKIRPEPFLLGSLIWILMMTGVWYILPFSIYKKASTFKESFIIHFQEEEIQLENERGYTIWEWNRFSRYFESPHFFHLYFDEKSFFIVPKENMSEAMMHDIRGLLQRKINC
jgi:hypothetical protein